MTDLVRSLNPRVFAAGDVASETAAARWLDLQEWPGAAEPLVALLEGVDAALEDDLASQWTLLASNAGRQRVAACATAGKAAAAGSEAIHLALCLAVEGFLATRSATRRTVVMGVINVTPDSFSDGGRYLDREAAIAHGVEMATEGAHWLDVGGESTRPGAASVSAEEEARRVIPVIQELRRSTDCRISVDTTKASVAALAVDAGADIINDVSGLRADPEMARVAAQARATLILMHSRGTPETMQTLTDYEDVVADSMRELRIATAQAEEAGVPADRLWIDPGFGFAKTADQNLELLARLREYASLGYPIMLGTSRKSTLGMVLGGLPPEERGEATAATVALGIANGAAAIRVHDVREMSRVARMTDAIRNVGR